MRSVKYREIFRLYLIYVTVSVCVLDIVNWVFLVVAFTDDHDIIPKTAHARGSV